MDYYNQDFNAEKILIQNIRASLSGKNEIILIPDELSFDFHKQFSRICISIFTRGEKVIRFNSRRNSLQQTIERIIQRIQQHYRFKNFNINNVHKTRILFEIITQEKSCNINKASYTSNSNKFEPGINGIKAIYQGKSRYFFPTDAVVRHKRDIPAILQLFAQKFKLKAQNKKAVTTLMKSAPIEYKLLKSAAFVSYHDKIFPLLRGFPMPQHAFTKDSLYQSIVDAIDWLVDTIHDNGRFTYFYDGIRDSHAEIKHANDPDYYNMLRHSGATISLCMAYEISHDKKYLRTARKAIDYSLSVMAVDPLNKNACYPMCRNKSKLGGAGITLVAYVKYYALTQDESLLSVMQGLVTHILSRIQISGEFFSFYIHPLYNNSQPILEMDDKAKKEYFSFYYPGEALLGLALYYRYIKNIPSNFKQEIYTQSKLAINFLVEIRPKKYPELFTKVPNDAWLMQAIEEWVKVDGFAKQSYYDFLFSDGKAISDYMLASKDSPSINIGARAEGIIAAYYTAQAIGEHEIADELISSINKSVKSLMKTQHTSESTYAHIYPEKSIGTFSFRMTEQWIRIDTIQHTAVLLMRLYLSGKIVEDIPTNESNSAKKKTGNLSN